MCFRWFFEKKYGITPPVNTKKINMEEIYSILDAQFPKAETWVSDNEYQTTTFSEYERFLHWNQVDKRLYIKEYYDCDDFSFQLMGDSQIPGWSSLAFGILWTSTPNGGHAVNFFIDNNYDIWIVEPQNDHIFSMPKEWEEYLVIM